MIFEAAPALVGFRKARDILTRQDRPLPHRQLLPLTFFQRNRLVKAALDPETSEYYHALYTQSWAIRIKPGLSLRKVQRAFNQVTKRHDSLRMCIAETDSDWMMEILPEHPTGLVVEDHGPVPKNAQEKIVADKCAAPMTVLDPILFTMHLLRFGDEGDILLTRAQHAIFDGHSVGIVMSEMFSYLFGLPVTSKPVSQKTFLDFRARELEKRVDEKQAYWESAVLPNPPLLNIGRKKKGLPPLESNDIGPPRVMENILVPEASDRIRQVFKATGLSPMCQLQAVFGDVLCEMGGGSETTWRCIVGRQEARLSGFVGPAMQGISVKYTAGSGPQYVRDIMARGAEMLPSVCIAHGAPLTQFYQPYFVNMPEPLGPLLNSPLRNAVGAFNAGGFSIGPVHMEHVPAGATKLTNYELEMKVGSLPEAPDAEFVADAASWEMSELRSIADAMNDAILSSACPKI